MTDLEFQETLKKMVEETQNEVLKWNLINAAETSNQLEVAILAIADKEGFIPGRSKEKNAQNQASVVKGVINGSFPPNYLTRSYGIRAQALYLKHYNAD